MQLTVLRYPSLDPVAAPMHLPKGEIYDATFSETSVSTPSAKKTLPHLTMPHMQLVVATTVSLLVYSLPPKSTEGEKSTGKQKNKLPELELKSTIDRPTLPGSDAGSSFRSARFHPTEPNVLYTVVNTVAPKKAKKNAPKRAYICKWDSDTWKLKKFRKVSDRALTCFDIRCV